MRVKHRIIVVGAGIFGVTAALELSKRGNQVTLMDSGNIPHSRAASTDISKIIRMDYGADHFYTGMMEEAFKVWDRWNQEWEEPLYHPVGFLLLTLGEIKPGDLEYDSFQILEKLGYAPQRISSTDLRSRYPAWNPEKYKDGYFNPHAGWADSQRVVKYLANAAVAAGVVVHENLSAIRLCDDTDRISGVIGSDGVRYPADTVVVAAGTWSPLLAEQLKDVIIHTAHPVFHFQPREPASFQPPHFPVWSADIGKTGWYGFPANEDGILKVANHGPGRKCHPDDDRRTTPEDEIKFREFLKGSLPAMGEAPIVSSRICFYSDSWDGDFYIDRDPLRAGLVYATGGSGHGFKFAPVLGPLVADIVEGKANPYAKRFAWRTRVGTGKKEQARYQG